MSVREMLVCWAVVTAILLSAVVSVGLLYQVIVWVGS